MAMATEIYVVLEGGCVKFVSASDSDSNINVCVVDLDDMNDAVGVDREEMEAKLVAADSLVRVW